MPTPRRRSPSRKQHHRADQAHPRGRETQGLQHRKPLAILEQVKTSQLQTFRNDKSQEEGHAGAVVGRGLRQAWALCCWDSSLYVFLLIYGSMVVRSVIGEKNNRVLGDECRRSPFDLMMGKILGVASVAIGRC